jgi:mRNA-degrading endonuclease RelE of RelBE toxin-antitoxin system
VEEYQPSTKKHKKIKKQGVSKSNDAIKKPQLKWKTVYKVRFYGFRMFAYIDKTDIISMFTE